MRIFVLIFAALGLLAEAVVFGGLLYILGDVIGAYSMSMGKLSADSGRTAIWTLGAVLGFGLALLAMLLTGSGTGLVGVLVVFALLLLALVTRKEGSPPNGLRGIGGPS